MEVVYRNLSNRIGLPKPHLGHISLNGKKYSFPYDMIRYISIQDYEKCTIHTLNQMLRLRDIGNAKVKKEKCSRLREWDERMKNQTPYVNPDDPLPLNILHPLRNRRESYTYYVNWVQSPENGGGCTVPDAIFYGYLAFRLYDLEEFPIPSEFYDIVRCVEPVNVNSLNLIIVEKGSEIFSIYGKDAKKLYNNFRRACAL